MDIQQSINLTLFSRFAREEIEFSYQSRTVYLVNPSGKEPVVTQQKGQLAVESA